jgi:hypothetical protein
MTNRRQKRDLVCLLQGLVGTCGNIGERSHRCVVAREPRRVGEKSCVWVVDMQWGVKMSKDYGGRPRMEVLDELKQNIWTTITSVMTS